MNQFLTTCFSAPILPATLLLILVALYWLMVIFGALTPDFLDWDVDLNGDLAPDSVWDSVFGIGMGTLRFLNIGSVPIMLWTSMFALAFWLTAMLLARPMPVESMTHVIVAVLRNALIAVAATKLLTQPLRGRFDVVEPASGEELIDTVGEVTSFEVSPTSGQAIFPAAAAPLLLNVRSVDGCIDKGRRVRIVSYDAAMNIYHVELVDQA